MNVPKGRGPFPILILNHGYIDPAVYTNGRGLKREQDYLARQGYVVVHPDYRNHAESDDDPEVRYTFRLGYTEDVINLVYALRAANLPYLDAQRIGMLGHSMGGGIAQNVAVIAPGLVKAYVLFAPTSGDQIDNFNKYNLRRADEANEMLRRYGTAAENPNFWKGISASTYYTRITEPVLIQIGTADESTPLEWSQRIADHLRELAKDVTLYTYAGEPHEFMAAWPSVMRRTVDFFNQHLKEREADRSST